MVDIKQYGEVETAWCPGCGNFSIRKALIQALADSDLEPHQILLVSGIGQAAKTPTICAATASTACTGAPCPRPQGRAWPTAA